MNYIELKETVTPKEYGDFYYEEYTQDGNKFREIEMMHEDGVIAPIGTEVHTPNCGWVVDDTNPSFKCKQCTKECPEYKKWMDFYKEEGYL